MLSRLRTWSGMPTLRHLLLETFIIVVGVLIALAVNQWADGRHWRGEVASFREAADLEIGNNLWVYQYRREQARCIEARLDELATLAAGWQRGERLKLDRPIVRFTARTGRMTLWESRTPEVVSHLDPQARVNYARAYADIENYMRQIADERTVWRQLQIANWTVSMTPERAAEYQRDVEVARNIATITRLNFKVLAANAARLGIAPVPPEAHDPWDRAICRSLRWSPA